MVSLVPQDFVPQVLDFISGRKIKKERPGMILHVKQCHCDIPGSFVSCVSPPGWLAVSVLHFPCSPAHTLTITQQQVFCNFIQNGVKSCKSHSQPHSEGKHSGLFRFYL